MKTLTHLQSRIFDTPLAIQPQKLEIILAALGERIGLMNVDAEALLAARGTAPATRKSYSINADGIAVIPIQGALLKKASGLMALSGSTSYEEINTQLEDAFTSPQVKGIVLDVDSPGGETHGMFELADLINSLRGQKPIYAVANDSAYSAAYALASAAEKLYLTQTAGVGSIGVYVLHCDQSGADKQAGLSYTYVKAGDHKAEGNSHEPLSDNALATVQAEINRNYAMFCTLVARNRGISMDAVVGTQAGVLFADGAVPLLADQVGTLDDAIADMTATIAGASKSKAVGIGKAVAVSTNINTFEAQMKETSLDTLKTEAEIAPNATAVAKADDEMEAKSKKSDPDSDEDEDDADSDTGDDADDKTKAAMITRIVNLCSLANLPNLAASYINNGMTDKQVEKLLLEQRSMKSQETKLSSTLDNTQTSATAAYDRIAAGAAKIAKEERISNSAAYARLLTQNPHLYDEYLDERDSASESRKASKAYIAAMQQRLSLRGNY